MSNFDRPYSSTSIQDWHDYNRLFPKTWQDGMRQHAQRLSHSFGVEYYDFSRDSRFERRLEWHADADHTNWAGSREFSRLLKQAMDAHGG